MGTIVIKLEINNKSRNTQKNYYYKISDNTKCIDPTNINEINNKITELKNKVGNVDKINAAMWKR